MNQSVYLQSVFDKFNFLGSDKEQAELKNFISVLANTHTGCSILDSLSLEDRKLSLSFNPELATKKSGNGCFIHHTNTIELIHIDSDASPISQAEGFMVIQTLAHELQHAAIKNVSTKMAISASNDQELTYSIRLDEASARFMAEQVIRELAQQDPGIDKIYIYHDSSGKECRCASRDDPNFIRYKGSSYSRRREPIDDPKEFLRQCLMGRYELVNISTEQDKKELNIPRHPNKKVFMASAQKILSMINVDMTAEELFESVENSSAPTQGNFSSLSTVQVARKSQRGA